jgi:hypothetical protein
MNNEFEKAVKEVAKSSQGLLDAWDWDEENPDDPHGEDSVDYAEDCLYNAVTTLYAQFAKQREEANRGKQKKPSRNSDCQNPECPEAGKCGGKCAEKF